MHNILCMLRNVLITNIISHKKENVCWQLVVMDIYNAIVFLLRSCMQNTLRTHYYKYVTEIRVQY